MSLTSGQQLGLGTGVAGGQRDSLQELAGDALVCREGGSQPQARNAGRFGDPASPGRRAAPHSPSSPSSSTWSAQLGFELREHGIGERVPAARPAPRPRPPPPPLRRTRHPPGSLKVAGRHRQVQLHAAPSPGRERKRGENEASGAAAAAAQSGPDRGGHSAALWTKADTRVSCAAKRWDPNWPRGPGESIRNLLNSTQPCLG